MRRVLLLLAVALVLPATTPQASAAPQEADRRGAGRRPNVLLIVADDLTATAMSCYGSEVCRTPNLDALAEDGVRFTRAYCQGTYCGPSRASFLSGYYPHALKMLGYRWPKERVGDRATWPRHFKDAGYHTARVGKIFHMGVPGDIEKGADGADDPDSWSERHNVAGPEWRAPGEGQTLEGNPDRSKPVMGGNTFVAVAAKASSALAWLRAKASRAATRPCRATSSAAWRVTVASRSSATWESPERGARSRPVQAARTGRAVRERAMEAGSAAVPRRLEGDPDRVPLGARDACMWPGVPPGGLPVP